MNRTVLCVAAAALVVTACGTEVSPGAAEPVDPSAEPGLSSTAAPTTSSGSARPADLDLAGLDPCSVIPVDVVTSLGYSPSKEGQDQTGATEFACSYRDINGIDGTALFFDTSKGYEQFMSGSPSNVNTPINVVGYRAYSVQNQNLGGCTVGVDVADSQSVAASRTGALAEPVAPLCDRAAEFAAAAVTALQAR